MRVYMFIYEPYCGNIETIDDLKSIRHWVERIAERTRELDDCKEMRHVQGIEEDKRSWDDHQRMS